MAELEAALEPLADDKIVKSYLKGVEDDLKDAQDVLKVAAVAELEDLLAL